MAEPAQAAAGGNPTRRLRRSAAARLLALHGVIGGGILLRMLAVARTRFPGTPEVAMLLGWLGALAALLAIWHALACNRPAEKLPRFLFGLAAAWLLLQMTAKGLVAVQMDAVIVAGALLAGILIPLTVLRVFGLQVAIQSAGGGGHVGSILTPGVPPADEGRLARPNAAIPESNASASVAAPFPRSDTTWQASTWDILCLITSIAVLISVGQRASTYPLPPLGIVCLAGYGLAVGISALACLWLGLGRGWLWLRLLLVVASIPGVAGCTRLATGILYVNSFQWYLLSCACGAISLTFSLMIFRFQGYRMTWQTAAS